MLMVYVSHPWGGKRGNKINADEETTNELTSKMYYQPVRRQYVWNLLEEIGGYHA